MNVRSDMDEIVQSANGKDEIECNYLQFKNLHI